MQIVLKCSYRHNVDVKSTFTIEWDFISGIAQKSAEKLAVRSDCRVSVEHIGIIVGRCQWVTKAIIKYLYNFRNHIKQRYEYYQRHF